MVFYFISLMIRRTPVSTLVPYTTLCRSEPQARLEVRHRARRAREVDEHVAAGKCAVRWSGRDRKSTRLNSSHANISYAVFCLKNKSRGAHSADAVDS